MLKRILYSKTKTITFGALLLAGSSLLSKLLAIFRNNLLATGFPNEQTDIYFAAFRVPDFIYGIIITGGIVAAFLPVFASHHQKGTKQAQDLFSNVFWAFSFSLMVISLVLFLFAGKVAQVIVPGFSPAQQEATAQLMRIMFLSPILLGMSAIFSGVLHYFNLFFAYALAPILYNIGIIIGILLFYPVWGLSGLAWGVILGALMHLLCQVPIVFKKGFLPRLHFNILQPGLKQILRLMLPRTMGSAGYHINLIVVTAIASTISIGAISIFNYADYLYGVPISLIGVSFAIVIFPILSRNFAQKKYRAFIQNFNTGFSQILFLSVPAVILFFLLRAQLVRFFYGTSMIGNGYFTWQETRLTAACLGLFALSLASASLVPFLSRAFFAVQDTKTPVKITLLSVILNIILSFLFVAMLKSPNLFTQKIGEALRIKDLKNIAVLGLPLALTISSWLQFLLLLLFLRLKLPLMRLNALSKPFFKMLISGLIMVPVVWLALRLSALVWGTSTVKGILTQLAVASILGYSIYVLMMLAVGSDIPKQIWQSVTQQFSKAHNSP